MQQPLPSLRAIAPFVALLLLAPLGCKDEPKPAAAPPATPAAPAAPAMKSGSLGGVTFDYPADWKLEEAADKKSVLVIAPSIDGGWQSSVHFSIADNARDGDIGDIVEASLELLAARKQDFRLERKETLSHPNGFKYGRIDYANTNDSDANIPLRQAAIHMVLPAKKRLEIQASTGKDVWEKYQPTFDRIIASVKLPK